MNKMEQLQDLHCDATRTSGKRFRVLRNIGEVAPFFPQDETIMCYGSGDGFEVEVWKLLGYNAFGYDISSKKGREAWKHGVITVNSRNMILSPCNIYCAHTLEHLSNPEETIEWWMSLLQTTICCIFPIEPNGSQNPSHLSPIRSIEEVRFPETNILRMSERWNDEREGIIVARRK